MSANIINLRQARKAKTRIAKEKRAGENRAKFGQPKAQRNLTALDEARHAERLDGAKLDKTKNTVKENGTNGDDCNDV